MSNEENHHFHNSWTNGPNISLKVFYSNLLIQKIQLSRSQSVGTHLDFFDADKQDEEIFTLVSSWVQQYCAGKQPLILLPFNWNLLPPFTKLALQQLQDVPLGTTFTYGEFSRNLNLKNGAHAIGTACRLNPFPLFVPCHRILDAKQDNLSACPLKQYLLEWEKNQLA